MIWSRPLPNSGVLNFTSIWWRNCCYTICVKNSCFHPGEAVIPTERTINATLVTNTKDFPKHTTVKLTLELNIMDGELVYTLSKLESMVFSLEGMDHGCVVAMNMENIWNKVHFFPSTPRAAIWKKPATHHPLTVYRTYGWNTTRINEEERHHHVQNFLDADMTTPTNFVCIEEAKVFNPDRQTTDTTSHNAGEWRQLRDHFWLEIWEELAITS